MTVVHVDQRQRGIGLRQLLCRADAGKAAAQDQYVWFLRHLVLPLPYSPGLLCMMPPSTKTVVAVM